MQFTCASRAGVVDVPLGESKRVVMDQARFDQFAFSTLDEQRIHLDEDRAAAGPRGTTVAHGYPTLTPVSKFPPTRGSAGRVTEIEVEGRGSAVQLKSHATAVCDTSQGPVAVVHVRTAFVHHLASSA